jgi:tetratricopeptide (TPR) repeat protein
MALVACADIGVLHGLPPWSAAGPAFLFGALLGSSFRRDAPPAGAPHLLILVLCTAPIWLPWLDLSTRFVSSAVGWAEAGRILAIALGAVFGHVVKRPGLDRIALATAAVSAPLLLTSVVSRSGAVLAALVGGAIWFAASRGHDAPAPRDSNRWTGFGAGVFLGAIVPGLLLVAGPLAGPTVGLIVRAGACVAGGLVIASLLDRSPARPARYLGPVAGLAALFVVAGGPSGVLWMGDFIPAAPAHAGAALMGLLGLAVLVPASLTPRLGPGTSRGSVLGLAAWWILPPVLGPEAPVLLGLVVWAVSLLPDVKAIESPGLRIAAALSVALGAAAPLVPLPGDGLRAFAPYSLADGTGGFVDVVTRFAAADADVVGGAQGQAIRFTEESGVARVWRAGRSLRLDERTRDPDRFLGYLSALVGPTPERWLVLGSSLGATADAIRRTGVVEVTVFDGSPAEARVAADLPAWSRDLGVDPAVRRVHVDPLVASSQVYDAVVVDLPALGVFGASHAYSRDRVDRVAQALAPGGVAVFRLPLPSLSELELRRMIGRVTDAFSGVTAWLDPAGSQHVLLVATGEEARLDAGSVYRAWERPQIRSDLRLAAVDEPANVLDRAVADRPALALLASDIPWRDDVATDILAGHRLEARGRTLPLAALSAAASDPRALFDLDGVPADQRDAITERLARAGEVRGSYLEMLGHLAAGNSRAAMEAAEALPQGSGEASDLRVLTEPWLRRGDALIAKGRVEAAHAEYLLAFSFSPGDVEANRKLADTYRLQGKIDDAVRHYAIALEADPTNLEASLGLADAHAREGKLGRARDALADVQQSHPGSYILLVHLAHFESELASASPREAAVRTGRARALLQRASALEPSRPEARAGLARVYFLQGEYERALGEIDRALTIENSCVYRFWRGLIQYEEGSLDGAAGDLKTALLACPDQHAARNTLGAVYAASDRLDQAKTTWEDVVKRDPGNAGALANLKTLEASAPKQ